MNTTEYTIDAANQAFGRVASRVAFVLRGKHLPSFNPRILPTVQVLVRNLRRVRFTGNKLSQKMYHRHSGYPGGVTTTALKKLWESRPEHVMRDAVYHMLPKNKHRDKIIKHLRFE